MSVRKVVLIAVAVNLAFVALLGGLYWSQSVRAQAGSQPQFTSPDGEILGIVSEYMNYQGVLYDSGGNAVEGSHDLTFTLYACYVVPPTSTCSSQWSGTKTLDLIGGLINTRLGPLDATLFEPHAQLLPGWHLEVGVKVDGGTELAPRVSLNSTVPWAFTSIYSQHLPEADYDSGWWTPGELFQFNTFSHALGGDVDDYVVDLECKDNSDYIVSCDVGGAPLVWWYQLDTGGITVNAEDLWEIHPGYDLRVRIWVEK